MKIILQDYVYRTFDRTFDRTFVLFPAHSRSFEINLYQYKDYLSPHCRRTTSFYLNLPEMVFSIESWGVGDRFQYSLSGFFINNGQLYHPMLLNVNLGYFCLGLEKPHFSFHEQKSPKFIENVLLEDVLSYFFRSTFTTDYFDRFFNSLGFSPWTDKDQDGLHIFDENEIKRLNVKEAKDITSSFVLSLGKRVNLSTCIMYSRIRWFFEDWSKKSKKNKNYSIFEDFPGVPIDYVGSLGLSKDLLLQKICANS